MPYATREALNKKSIGQFKNCLLASLEN